MKWLIGLLTAATGILHLLVGFNLIGPGVGTEYLLVLNGVGYLVLLWLFWTSNGSRRGTIRWILLAYTLITLVGYFLLRPDSFGNIIDLIIKAIELLLVILLFLDRGSDRVVVAPVATATPTRTGAVVSSEAYQAASGFGTASSAAAIGAVGAISRAEEEAEAAADSAAADAAAWGDRTVGGVDLGLGSATTAVDMDITEADYDLEEIVEEGDEVVEEAGERSEDWLDRAGDRVGDAVDDTGDALAGAGAAVAGAVGGAVAWLGDKADDAADATAEAVDDAGDWVGDKVDDSGDATVTPIDATGDVVYTTGAGAGAAAGGAAEWVGDTPDATGELAAAADVAAGGAVEWVGDAPDSASVAAGGATEWVAETSDATGDVVDDTGNELADAGAAIAGAVGGAVAWLGDKAHDAADATGEAVDDAGDWVGDKVDDLGDATATTDDVVYATGAGAGVAAGASAEWVGDTGDANLGADRSVAAGGAAEWVGDTPDTTGELAAEADVAAGGAAEWVAETSDATGDLGIAPDSAAGTEPAAVQLRSELEEYLRSFGSGSEFRKEIEYIEGIGPTYGAKLRGVGIATVLDLMVEGATRSGRKHIADRSGLNASQILTWVNHIDLFRIKGVAQEYADLLEQSGVDTVVELAQRNPNNLFKRMNDINQQKQLVRRMPRPADVQSWVEQAKNLKRLIHY